MAKFFLFVFAFGLALCDVPDLYACGDGSGSQGGLFGTQLLSGKGHQRRSARRQARRDRRHQSASATSVSVGVGGYQQFPVGPTVAVDVAPFTVKEADNQTAATTNGVAKAAFRVGQHVQHAANANNRFPIGTGVITSVVPWNTGDGYSYRVRCDQTRKVLPVNFKESELSDSP